MRFITIQHIIIYSFSLLNFFDAHTHNKYTSLAYNIVRRNVKKEKNKLKKKRQRKKDYLPLLTTSLITKEMKLKQHDKLIK